MYTDKLPPHDIDAEEAVLGSLVIDGDQWPKVRAVVEAGAFYRDRDRWTFAAMERVIAGGAALNQVTVAHALEEMGTLDECGGPPFLSHLVSVIPTPLHAVHYANIVARCAMLRAGIQLAGEFAAACYEGEPELERLQGMLDALKAGRLPAGMDLAAHDEPEPPELEEDQAVRLWHAFRWLRGQLEQMKADVRVWETPRYARPAARQVAPQVQATGTNGKVVALPAVKARTGVQM